jgi:hypothetical protein
VQVRRKFAESSPKVRRKRTLRENCILKEQSARPPVSMASGRYQPSPRRLDVTWANVGNPGLGRAGLSGGCRRGGLCTIFHEVEAGSTAEGDRGPRSLLPQWGIKTFAVGTSSGNTDPGSSGGRGACPPNKSRVSDGPIPLAPRAQMAVRGRPWQEKTGRQLNKVILNAASAPPSALGRAHLTRTQDCTDKNR